MLIDNYHAEPVLAFERIHISYKTQGNLRPAVNDISFHINAGEMVAIVGESGSGKTTVAQAAMGLLAENGRINSGRLLMKGQDLTHGTPRQWNTLRGQWISLIPQDPNSSLNPIRTIGDQVDEALLFHRHLSKPAARQESLALLAKVGLPAPARHVKQYPHELSGGMKQRVLIAIAIALEPALIIADESTSALDVTVQKHILDILDDLRHEHGTAILFITHDLNVAAERSDRVIVFQQGRIQEQGYTHAVLSHPRSLYTRALLQHDPTKITLPRPRYTQPQGAPMISVSELVQEYPRRRGASTLRALDKISFTVTKGSTHAIVGESGSGKTTLAQALLGFKPPTSGHITVNGTEITHLAGKARRQFSQHIQLIYQNPFSSLDPLQSLFDIIEEPLRNFSQYTAAQRATIVKKMIRQVALPESLYRARPRQLSGGQCQRVAIARALVLHPEVLVLDEAVSALDVTVQAQILRLLNRLQQQFNLTYIFISHDLAVVRKIADTVSILYRGKQVESGSTEAVFEHPSHPYTCTLLDAIPESGLALNA